MVPTGVLWLQLIDGGVAIELPSPCLDLMKQPTPAVEKAPLPGPDVFNLTTHVVSTAVALPHSHDKRRGRRAHRSLVDGRVHRPLPASVVGPRGL